MFSNSKIFFPGNDNIVRGYTATFATPELVLQQAASKGAAPKAKAKAKAAAQSPKKEEERGFLCC